MNQEPLQDTELILNPDDSVYHLQLKGENIADTIILVGDQNRVSQVSNFFDRIDFKIQSREFVTHTGVYKGNPITVLSTGIGTDNIDIVLNELHAAVNVNPETRQFNEKLRKLRIVRIGTSGSLHEDIPIGSHVISEFSLGFDGLIYYYNHEFNEEEIGLQKEILNHIHWSSALARPYVVQASGALLEQVGFDMIKGITATATGFYGPQGRKLALELSNPQMNERFQSFSHDGRRVTNLEMETSGLYSLSKLLGHQCCTCCLILANREKKEFHEKPIEAMDELIEVVLDRLW